MISRDLSQRGGHFLLVGDSRDLATIRDMVAKMPDDAYGQVILEVATALQIQRWVVPDGITVTWLCRDTAPLGLLPARGVLAARAISAWAAEWLPEEDADHAWPYVLWIGCATSPAVDLVYRELGIRFDALHLHHPHPESTELHESEDAS